MTVTYVQSTLKIQTPFNCINNVIQLILEYYTEEKDIVNFVRLGRINSTFLTVIFDYSDEIWKRLAKNKHSLPLVCGVKRRGSFADTKIPKNFFHQLKTTTDIIERLIKYGINVNATVDCFSHDLGVYVSPIFLCSYRGDCSAVKLLYMAGVVKENFTRCACIAATRGHFEVVQFLFDKPSVALNIVISSATHGGHLKL